MEHKLGHSGGSCRRDTQDWTQRLLVYIWNRSLGTGVAPADMGHVTEPVGVSEQIFQLQKITAIYFDKEAGCSAADSRGFL